MFDSEPRMVIPPVNYKQPRRPVPAQAPEPTLSRGRDANRVTGARIRIPADSRSKQAQPLARCIAKAARKAGTTEGFVELIMVQVLEALVREVVRGETVTLPGLVRFGAKVFRPGKRGGCAYSIPDFAAVRGYRQELRFSLPPERVQSMTRFRKRHACGGVPLRTDRRSSCFLLQRERRLLAKGVEID